MNVLQRHYDFQVDVFSPDCPDYIKTTTVNESGNPIPVYVEVDNKKLCESLGTVDNYSLRSLLAAGINPDTHIHTGLASRLDGFSVVKSVESALNNLETE